MLLSLLSLLSLSSVTAATAAGVLLLLSSTTIPLSVLVCFFDQRFDAST